MRLAVTRFVSMACAGAAAILLGACAGMPATTAEAEIDYVRVAQIERAARAFGTQVIWINYPTKRAEAK